MRQRGFAPLIIVIVLVIIIAFLFTKLGQNKVSVNSETQKETIVLQENYSLTVDVPAEYSLISGLGDYANFIINKEGEKIIGFQKGTGGGELSPLGTVVIDEVPFTIDYRKDIGCPADIYPTKIKTGGENIGSLLYFGIYTWCEDDKETQNPIYKKIISSIKFNTELKKVLLGKVYAPKIK